ncbi:hypothetical protein FSP39_005012 [Pinctada imbricata]|uniref:Nuclear receptor domain-containing protein n=1 Tax=Pinctada imbricata TaxID=66713 RepID=A0AA88Y6F4_PINIB|nr:hypothetical protein FSP39_005012 [Pinctada imbricata]
MDKTKSIGQRKKKSQLVLPPCRVCEGNATGIHYGVLTCQGCKAFFQRYQKRKEPYVCSRNGNCDIVARKRGICSACRVEKCTRLGMSKTGE